MTKMSEEELKCDICDEVCPVAQECKYGLRNQGIQEEKERILKIIEEYNEKRYGHLKDTCESQEYDAILKLLEEIRK